MRNAARKERLKTLLNATKKQKEKAKIKTKKKEIRLAKLKATGEAWKKTRNVDGMTINHSAFGDDMGNVNSTDHGKSRVKHKRKRFKTFSNQ